MPDILPVLGNPWASAFLVPVVATALSVFVRHASQNDRHSRFRKEDCAIGFELVVTGISSLIIAIPVFEAYASRAKEAEERVGHSVSTMLLALLFFIGLWVISHIARKWGWKDSVTLHMWKGFLLPLAYGLLVLGASAWWIASSVKVAEGASGG